MCVCVRELQLCSQAIRSFMLISVIENIADGHKVINAHNGVIARFGFLVWIDNRNPNAIVSRFSFQKQNMQRSHWNPSLGFLLPNLSYFSFLFIHFTSLSSPRFTLNLSFKFSLVSRVVLFPPFQIIVHFNACYMVQMISENSDHEFEQLQQTGGTIRRTRAHMCTVCVVSIHMYVCMWM